MRSLFPGVAAAVLLCTATGCIHLTQTLMLNGDGSLLVRYDYSIAEESAATMEEGRRIISDWQEKTPSSQPDWFTQEAAVRQHFSRPGVTLQHFRSSVEGGRRHVQIQVFAEDGPGALNSGAFGGFHCARTAPDTVRIWADIPHPSTLDAGGGNNPVETFCDDLFLRLEFRVPGKIVHTSAPQKSKRAAIWEFDSDAAMAFLRKNGMIECSFSTTAPWIRKLPEGGAHP